MAGRVEAEEVEKELDASQVARFGGWGYLYGLVQGGDGPSSFPRFDEGLGVAKECLAETVVQVAPEFLSPVIPAPDTGQKKVVEDRALPPGSGFFYPALSQVLNE